MKASLLAFLVLCGLLVIAPVSLAQSQSYTWTTLAALPGTTTSSTQVPSPAVAVDAAGNLYVADLDNKVVKKLQLVGDSWVVTTLAGLAGVSGSADGTNANARFMAPCGITVDGAGTLYVTDDAMNNTVRRVAPVGTNWVVTTLAGLAGQLPPTGKADGTNSNARFASPFGIGVDSAGNLYVADQSNHVIRKVTPYGTNWVVSTIAGSGNLGFADGTNRACTFFAPFGTCVDGAGSVYVTDQGNETVRRLALFGTNWVVTTLAGTALRSGATDGTNQSALFNNPFFLTADTATNLYVADHWNNTIRKITPCGTNWVVSTIGGLAGLSGAADGTGGDARFNGPSGVAVDQYGNLYVVDFLNHLLRKGVPFATTAFLRDQAVPAGGAVTLDATAIGENGPFHYQWFFEGLALVGETHATLTLGAVERSNTGVYSVVVSNAVGNWTTLNASVRALVPPRLALPQVLGPQRVRLLFQDSDAGLPYDLSQVQAQWRAALPVGADTNWYPLAAAIYLTNGFVAVDDTNLPSGSNRFYRILER